MALIIAGLVFLVVVTLMVGLWWASDARRKVRARLEGATSVPGVDTGIMRVDPRRVRPGLIGSVSVTGAQNWLAATIEQAGYRRGVNDVILMIGACAAGGAVLGWFRTGALLWTVPAAILAGSLPILFLRYKRRKRLQRFEHGFPDALDTMARAIRAGNALSAAIQLVGDEMPEPIGPEFKQVFEETRLGLDPGEALSKLGQRVPTEDMVFFCSALRIQRSAGGNLAELLDRLSEVIRERYKILSHARVLSAQHKYSAICVGLSPIIFAILIELLNPGYFEPLLTSSVGPLMISLGLLLEAVGFFMIWRIAKIKV